MTWQQARIQAPSDCAEAFSDALLEVGALSASIEDAFAGTEHEQAIFGEPNEPIESMWTHSILIALFEHDAPVAQHIQTAANMCQRDVPEWTLETVDEQDWVRNTQAQFDPIQISPRLWIIPSWHEAPNPNAINLTLDPGLAFGTGAHPTTRLCLEWLEANLKGGERILDYGCGSGILAIAAKKLGAGEVWGTDIDQQALDASRHNAAHNHVHAQFYAPNELPEQQTDILVANILANPLRMLASLLAARVVSGGQIVLSGLLEQQIDELSAIYQAWFDMDTPSVSEGWARLSGRRR